LRCDEQNNLLLLRTGLRSEGCNSIRSSIMLSPLPHKDLNIALPALFRTILSTISISSFPPQRYKNTDRRDKQKCTRDSARQRPGAVHKPDPPDDSTHYQLWLERPPACRMFRQSLMV
jgi:hypothetical protein